MDTIWVELAADSSAAHGPRLRIRLVSSHHPAVRQASIKAAYPPRTQTRVQPSTTGGEQLSSRQGRLERASQRGAETSEQQPDLHDGFGVTDGEGVAGRVWLVWAALEARFGVKQGSSLLCFSCRSPCRDERLKRLRLSLKALQLC